MMKMCLSKKSKKLKQLFSFALAVILCVPLYVRPIPTQATEAASLPESVTQEMAKAFADKLDAVIYDDYNENISVSFVEIGPNKTPVLWLQSTYDGTNEFFIYADSSLKQVFQFQYNYYGSSRWDEESSIDLVEYNGNKYFRIKEIISESDYFVDANPESDLIREEGYYYDHGYRNEKATLYTINQNQWTAVRTVGFESAYAEEYSIYPEKFGSPFTWHTDLSKQYTTTSDYNGWPMYHLDYRYYYISEGDTSKEITENEYNQYIDEVTQSKLSMDSQDLLTKLQHVAFSLNMDLPDILTSLSDESIIEMSQLISSFVDTDNGFDVALADNSQLFGLAEDLLMKSMIPTIFDDYLSDDSALYSKVASCEVVNQTINRLTGRTVDFTPYQLSELPTEDKIWADIRQSVGTSYIVDGNWHYFIIPGWYYHWYAEIQSFYEVGNNIFWAHSTVWDNGLNPGEEELIGTATAIFEKAGDDYRLLKIYPLNVSPSIEEVQQYVININPESNFKIDYTVVSSYTDLSQYVDALKTALAAANPLNDAGNTAVTEYVNFVVQNYAPAAVYARENVLLLSPETVRTAQASSSEAIAVLQKELGDVALLRAPILTSRIDVSGLDWTKPIRIRLDENVIAAAANLDSITLVLGDNQHMITVPMDGLRQLGYLDLQIEQIAQDQYNISFFDKSEQVIDQLGANITFALPASSEMSSIQALCNGYSDNWGGQYDSQNKTITFQTPYTGEYTVLEITIQISDIDYLSEEMQQAILFLVAKGYFDLDSEGRFNPSVGLNRYEFSKAAVKIFFALDQDAVTTFWDMTPDDPYYHYVASGQEQEIVKGYDDGAFHGDKNLLRDQMLVICGSTLVSKKNYAYPSDPSVYLNFVDSEDIGGWSQDGISLCVREGLIESGGALRPKQNVTRGEAAVILYRLFMLLYEVNPTPIKIVEASPTSVETGSSSSMSPAIIAGAAVVGVGGIGAIAYFSLSKKKPIGKKNLK